MSMNSVVPATDRDPTNKEVIEANRSAELLAAATEGRGDEVVQILEGDLELIRVGDTALHLLVRANYVEALCLLIRWFLQGKHYELLKEVAKQGNGDGDTPLHLAIKNVSTVAFLLYKVAPTAQFILNDDGKSPIRFSIEATGGDKWFTEYKDSLLELKPVLEMVDQFHRENPGRKRAKLFADTEMRIEVDRILEILEADINLIHRKDRCNGNTILHNVASSGDMDVLHKLIGFLTTDNDNDHRLRLLLEGNKFGDTPLHLAVYRRHITVARYLMDLAPETAYQVNDEGVSPLHFALKKSWDDFVKYVLEVMPEASISPGVRKTLLAPSKASILHTAIRKRDSSKLFTI